MFNQVDATVYLILRRECSVNGLMLRSGWQTGDQMKLRPLTLRTLGKYLACLTVMAAFFLGS